jgi:hypothetical protein
MPRNIPTIIDFEASGFGKGSYPIEVGFVTADGDAWCSLIKPDSAWQHWDYSAQNVHQISREVLFEYGKEARQVANHLNDVLLNAVVYSDAWMHDFVWMNRLFDLAETVPHFKLQDLREILTEKQQAVWHATKERVAQQLNQARHRASVDAKILQMTWLATIDL